MAVRLRITGLAAPISLYSRGRSEIGLLVSPSMQTTPSVLAVITAQAAEVTMTVTVGQISRVSRDLVGEERRVSWLVNEIVVGAAGGLAVTAAQTATISVTGQAILPGGALRLSTAKVTI